MEGEGYDPHVQAALQDAGLQRNGVQFRDLDGHVRIHGIELLQDGREKFLGPEGGDAQTDGAALYVVDVPQLCLGLPVDGLDLTGVFDESFSGGRQDHAPGGAQKELASQTAFELLQELGQGRLGHEELVGGFGNGAALRDGQDIVDFFQFHKSSGIKVCGGLRVHMSYLLLL